MDVPKSGIFPMNILGANGNGCEEIRGNPLFVHQTFTLPATKKLEVGRGDCWYTCLTIRPVVSRSTKFDNSPFFGG